ncbi:extracellular solute-binding protein [Microbacterium sp. CJ88]|uniref:extracellular solute-binding protein n=1 Tax=Microbacterium sp. CJ88 TaxID=3445672 RepID=UPI003F65DC2F
MKKTAQLGAIAGVVALALALTGCGRSADSAPSAGGDSTTIGSEPATGTLTMWAMGAEGEKLPEFVKTFEQANPGVKVEVTAIPWDAAYNKFQTAIAAGNTPDLAMVGSTWMADFTDAFSSVPTDLATDDFFTGSMTTNKVADRTVGVPWYVDTRVLYYRTDLAKQAGWDKAPTTWEELKQLASDYKTKAGATFGMRLPAGNDAFQGTLWMPWSNGGEITDGSKWTLDTPQMVEAYDYYQSFYTDGLADPNADIASGAQEAGFVDGSTPMLIDGPFMRGSLATIGGADFSSKYATAVVPAKDSSVSFSGGANLVVFNKGENQRSAWKLAQWLTQPETQVSWYQASGDLPSTQTAWKDSTLTGDANLATFGTQLETARPTPVTTTWVQVGAAADQALELIRRGQSTPKDALADLQSKADAIGMG